MDAGIVAVKTQRRLRTDFPGFRNLFLGQGGAERRYRIVKAVFGLGNHVHVTFADDDPPFFKRLVAGIVQIVQHPAFVKNRRIRRVQILRLTIAHYPAAESDHPAPFVHDRNDHPVAEKIVQLAVFLRQHRQSQLDHVAFAHVF